MNDRKGFALVTGTSSGVGAALARSLAVGGWQVLGAARRDVEAFPGYEHCALDLSDIGCVESLGEKLAERLPGFVGRPVALVNNAAVPGQRAYAKALDADTLARAVTVNLTTPILLMGLLHRRCPDGSPLRVVNVSTGLATNPMAGVLDYCSSKAGLLMASRVFEAELEGRTGSGVLVYEPGIVDTEMQATLRSTDREQFPAVEVFEAMKREGRLATAAQVIGPIIGFLESASTGLVERRYGA